MGSVTRPVPASLEEKKVSKNMPHKEKTGKLPPFSTMFWAFNLEIFRIFFIFHFAVLILLRYHYYYFSNSILA